MDEWLQRNFVLGWVLSAVVNFTLAGMHLYGVFENYPSTHVDVAVWGGLGLLSLSLAIAFRSRTKRAASQ